MISEVRGLRVVDLGCGYGGFCRWAERQGAQRVLGIDNAQKMLDRASSMTDSTRISYRRLDLDRVRLPPRSADLIFSSLAFHYVRQLRRLLHQVGRALGPGGRLVFSVEHPIYLAPTRPGWSLARGRVPAWQLDGYSVEGPRLTQWLGSRVRKQHRTLATYLNLLTEEGLSLVQLEEWRPSRRQLAAHPEWVREMQRPMFLLIAARKSDHLHRAEDGPSLTPTGISPTSVPS